MANYKINYNIDISPHIEKYTYRKLTEMLWQTEDERKHFDKVHRGKHLTKEHIYERNAMDDYVKILYNELVKRRQKYSN